MHAAEDNTIRLALIGCGGRGGGAVRDAFSVAAGPVKLHAMADLTEDRVNRSHEVLQDHFADRVDVPADRRFVGFDAYRHAIDCLRPGDVAMLTAYAYCRPVQIEYAVKKGVNVFMEKTSHPIRPVAAAFWLRARQRRSRISRSPRGCNAATASPGRH